MIVDVLPKVNGARSSLLKTLKAPRRSSILAPSPGNRYGPEKSQLSDTKHAYIVRGIVIGGAAFRVIVNRVGLIGDEAGPSAESWSSDLL